MLATAPQRTCSSSRTLCDGRCAADSPAASAARNASAPRPLSDTCTPCTERMHRRAAYGHTRPSAAARITGQARASSRCQPTSCPPAGSAATPTATHSRAAPEGHRPGAPTRHVSRSSYVPRRAARAELAPAAAPLQAARRAARQRGEEAAAGAQSTARPRAPAQLTSPARPALPAGVIVAA